MNKISFTYEEQADINFKYVREYRKFMLGRRLYHQEFQNRRLPQHSVFQRVDRVLRECGK